MPRFQDGRRTSVTEGCAHSKILAWMQFYGGLLERLTTLPGALQPRWRDALPRENYIRILKLHAMIEMPAFWSDTASGLLSLHDR